MDRSNEVSVQWHILQQQLSNLRAIEDDLRHEQEELQRQLEEVQKKRDAAEHAVVRKQRDIKECENMLLPIGAFPTEILSLIFLHVVSFIPGDLEEPPHPMSLTLSSVCRRWRSVLLGNPKFWTHINLAHSRLYNLDLYLSRSAGLPLEISFFGTWDISPSDTRARTLLHILGKETHRWQRLQMDVTGASCGFLPFLSQKRATSFTYIHLSDEGIHMLPSLVPAFPAFAVHQNDLHTLIFVRVPMFKALVAPRLQHLTFISRWDDAAELLVAPDRLCRVLSSTKNLQTRHLGVGGVLFDGPMKTILLPQLHHFTISFDSMVPDLPQLASLFDMVSAPALQVIGFTAEDRSINQMEGFAWAFNRKPRYPTVIHVVLHNILHRAADVRVFVNAFPDIKILTLDLRGMTLCNTFLQKHPWSYECWEKLEMTRVRSRTEGLDFGQSRWKAFYAWLRRREKLGLPPSALELVTPAVRGASVPFYLEWESVIRFDVRIERMSEGKLGVHQSRIW